MRKNLPHQIHFIGAGGVGVAGVAHIAADLGAVVTGSDQVESAMTCSLQRRGLNITCARTESSLPAETELVVYSSAVPERDGQRQEASRRGIPQLRRGEFLNQWLAPRFSLRVAVSGSHGKSTTAALLAYLLQQCGVDTGYLVGAMPNGAERNASAGGGKILVTEVDESDGTQAGFPADIAIVLNIDDDHSWSLGGREKLLLCFQQLCSHASEVISAHSILGLNVNQLVSSTREFPGILPGVFQENAACAWRALELIYQRVPELFLHAPNQAMTRGFPGIGRRMTVHYATPQFVLIEDYAHHPTELEATLSTLRRQYPGYGLNVIFQPHRLERVERYGGRFAELLSGCDWCGVTAPFGAWRTDGAQVDMEKLLTGKIGCPHVAFAQDMSWEEMGNFLLARIRGWQQKGNQPHLLAVIGAGDVGKLVPLLRKKLRE